MIYVARYKDADRSWLDDPDLFDRDIYEIECVSQPGFVESVIIDWHGSGWAFGDTVEFPQPTGCNGMPAIGRLRIFRGKVIGVVIANPGVGYAPEEPITLTWHHAASDAEEPRYRVLLGGSNWVDHCTYAVIRNRTQPDHKMVKRPCPSVRANGIPPAPDTFSGIDLPERCLVPEPELCKEPARK